MTYFRDESERETITKLLSLEYFQINYLSKNPLESRMKRAAAAIQVQKERNLMKKITRK